MNMKYLTISSTEEEDEELSVIKPEPVPQQLEEETSQETEKGKKGTIICLK